MIIMMMTTKNNNEYDGAGYVDDMIDNDDDE